MFNLYALKSKLLTWFGDIKIYKYPFWMIYCPSTYLVKGKETRIAINMIRDGDLILRGYRDYLDGKFIPGAYSHTGIYVGDGKMIHATAEGVNCVDIIDFLRCDRFVILRPIGGQDIAIARAKTFLEKKLAYDFNFESWNNAMYCHELGAQCYYGILKIEKKVPTLFRGLIKGNPAYLAESFLDSPDFEKIYEFF